MRLRQWIEVCGEELQKAMRAVIAAYGVIRDADERALAMLFLLFRDR